MGMIAACCESIISNLWSWWQKEDVMGKKLAYLTSLALLVTLAPGDAFGDLVAYYPMNEGAGRLIKDASGNGHDGEAQADPAWVDGQTGYGKALYFDGTEPAPAWVSCGTWDPSDETGELGVACWIKWDGTNGQWQGIVAKRDGWDGDETTAPVMWFLEVSTNGDMKFSRKGLDIQFGEKPPVGEWIHVVVAFDGSIIKLYINAEEKNSADFSFGPMRNATLTIGCDNLGGANAFFGTIDEVRLYDNALAAGDIEAVMFDTGRDPELAKAPKPKDKMVEVPRDAILQWGPGCYAVKHNVYFGTSFEDVNLATVSDPRGVLIAQGQTDAFRDPVAGLLDYGQTYYWRVDEFNDAEPNSPWRGNVWSFTVRDYVLVDDFEGYTENAPDRVFDVWADFAVNNTGMTAGYFDPPYVEQTAINVHGGKKSMPLAYDNDGTVNEATKYETSGTQFYSQVERSWPAPQDWAQDVNSLSVWYKGYASYCGAFAEQPAGVYTVRGSGADIWKKADEFHFAYKQVPSGACTIIAKVESLEPLNKDTKAGVMIRNSLEPGSVNTALLLTPDPEKGLRFQNRTVADGDTARGDNDLDPNAMPPYWLKLQRTSGGLVRAYRSPDGATWTQFALKSVTMQMPIYIGLAVTSHDAAQVCEATFSNVSFPEGTGLATQPWADADVGIQSNESEPMYVAVNGQAVYNDDPDAVLSSQWTSWSIPLSKFSDMGVDLAAVNSLAIGFGTIGGTQPGGHGKLFIDDIRLYVPVSQ
jgi:hypothetical protein